MGEGGAIATNNPRLARLAESFRNWGRDCVCKPGQDNACGKRYSGQFGELPFGYDHKNVYSKLGFNLKMTDMQAAIGLSQLERLDEFIKKRKENFDYIHGRLKKYEDALVLPNHLPEAEPSWFGYLVSVREDAGFTRKEIVDFLDSRKISTRALFAGNITRHPCFEGVKYRTVGYLKNTDRAMNDTFWIGVQPNLTEEKREYVLDAFDSFFKK
jgi:CDP-6-deoxy-D-xylo-4-hexulose-3-dehydrase